jgi:hypothetical protein
MANSKKHILRAKIDAKSLEHAHARPNHVPHFAQTPERVIGAFIQCTIGRTAALPRTDFAFVLYAGIFTTP